MSENIVQDSLGTDLAERVFTTLLDNACRLNPSFITDAAVVSDHLVKLDDTEQWYTFEGRIGTGGGRWGMPGVGFSFALSEVACSFLDPGELLQELPDRVPQGRQLLDSFTATMHNQIRSADQALLFGSWGYGVDSFYPAVRTEHALWIDLKHGDRQTRLITRQPQEDQAMRDHNLSFRARRRHIRELREIHQAQTAQHISHILDRLHLDALAPQIS